jgi:hypothetical protein
MVGEALDLSAPPDSKVNFVMDKNPSIQSGVDLLFDWSKSEDCALDASMRLKLGSLSWEDSAACPGIQAADLLADSWHAWFHKGDAGLAGERRVALHYLLEGHRRELGIMKARGLNLTLEQSITKEEDFDLIRNSKSPRELQQARAN